MKENVTYKEPSSYFTPEMKRVYEDRVKHQEQEAQALVMDGHTMQRERSQPREENPAPSDDADN